MEQLSTITIVYLQAAFYLFAGANHFFQPKLYGNLFPKYLEAYKTQLNVLSGVAEVILGLGLLFLRTQNMAAWGIFALLLLFIPVHIYMVQKGVFTLGNFTIKPWMSWVRLLVIHPILLAWAFLAT